jgi:pentatricopeptide repeat protein
MSLLKKKTVQPNICSFNMIIHGLCKGRKVRDAKKLIQCIGEHGFVPYVVTYNTLIDGHCRKMT